MKKVLLSCCAFTLLFLFQNCNEMENPNYPAEPFIEFKEIKFIEVGGVADWDTLKLTFSYRDGDSDLGLDHQLKEHRDYPYHPFDLFVENGVGDTTRVTPTYYTGYQLSVEQNPYPNGKLITHKTRLKAPYNFLPEFNPSQDWCSTHYNQLSIEVPEHLKLVDESFNLGDTLHFAANKNYIQVHDYLLFEYNPDHNNISVKLYLSDDGITFTGFDWFTNFCYNYDGRFPVISEKSGTIKIGPFKIRIKNPWEGTFTYSMSNTSFLPLFGDKFGKIVVTIKDRALHTSNIMETPVFKLKDIH